MSTSEEIQAVFEHDIAMRTHQVVAKRGMRPLLEGVQNMHVFHMSRPVRGDGDVVTDWAPPQTREDD